MGLSSVQKQQPGIGCNCKSEDIFAPIKSKMRVLKKIKKRIGLAPRSTNSFPGPNNLPPLQFHQVHGDNIRICKDGTMAKRYESFCKGITFSARPVKINERVYVKFSEISNNWSGVIRFGFTYNDPATLRNSLPKYACPDLTNRPGYWAKALNERFCEKDYVLFYYVTATGDVHFGLNGEEKGIFINGVETRSPLWTLIDIYGNCSAIEFLDSRIYMYQQQSQQQQHHNVRRSLVTETEIDRFVPAFQSLSVNEENAMRPCVQQQIVTPISGHTNNGLVPIQFHQTTGKNIILSHDRRIATRIDTEFSQGYVFTAWPLRIGEKIIVKILRTEHKYVSALALGLTSCDPATLQSTDLPDDSDMLLDRPEYWVVSKDVASTPVIGDEIVFCVTQNGEVQISKNGGHPTVVMHVDQSLRLWAFLDVFGSTTSVRMFTQAPAFVPAAMPESPRRLQVQLPSTESVNSLCSILSANQQQQQQQLDNHRKQITAGQQQQQLSSSRILNVTGSGDMIQLQPGSVLVVNLPPTTVDAGQHSQSVNVQQTQSITAAAGPSAVIQSSYSNSYNDTKPAQKNYSSTHSWQATSSSSSSNSHTTGAECTICYEHPIDSVLYTCGHMCMCYECAIQQWRGIGGGHCPLCRAVINDVIRTYKS